MSAPGPGGSKAFLMEEDVRFLDDRVGGWAEKNGLIDAVRYFPLLFKANTRALYDKGPLEGRPNCQNLPFKMEGREGSIEGGTEGRRDRGTEGRRDCLRFTEDSSVYRRNAKSFRIPSVFGHF